MGLVTVFLVTMCLVTVWSLAAVTELWNQVARTVSCQDLMEDFVGKQQCNKC